MKLAVPIERLIAERVTPVGIRLLPIEARHVGRVETLPFHHRDPFDRMLAAQGLVDELTVVSADPVFDAYGVARVW